MPEPDATDLDEKQTPREAGGTTGAGNLSPAGTNRTGGATGGVDSATPDGSPRSRDVTPDA